MTPVVLLLGWSTLDWSLLDTWSVVIGALSGMACALLGVFLVLRRMSMMGDAISHAVLPGLALAFLLTGTRTSGAMLAGAVVIGVVTAGLTEWIRRAGKVEEGAAMGVVFTLLFAAGLVLIQQSAHHVDLDPDCVLHGSLVLAALDVTHVLGLGVPRAALTSAAMLAVNALFIGLLFKELRIAAFDPALATTQGFSARGLHYLLMTLVAATTVIAFESVGSILVIAMLIVPAATAQLLTDRLSVMLFLSAALAALAAFGGHLAAITTPAWFGYPGVSTNTAGMISVVSGLFFATALLLAPRYGLLGRAARNARLSLRIVSEDILGLLYRLEESGAPRAAAAAGLARLRQAGGPLLSAWALAVLRRRGRIAADPAGPGYRLTDAGRRAARELIRSHRLWESYMQEHAELPADHLHHPAERLEHVTSPELRGLLAETLGAREHDPHGTQIPPEPPRA